MKKILIITADYYKDISLGLLNSAKKNLQVGQYVKVPFGKSQITGVIWNKFQEETKKKFNLYVLFESLRCPKQTDKKK